jgi:hypothetical protein
MLVTDDTLLLNNIVLNTTLYIIRLLIYEESMIRPKVTSMVDEPITATYSDIDRKIENTVRMLQ